MHNSEQAVVKEKTDNSLTLLLYSLEERFMVMKPHAYFKNICLNLALGCLLLLLNRVGMKTTFAQDGPPVPPRIGWPTDSYKFIDTNWNSTYGFAPRSFSGIEGVTGWWTNMAMRIVGTGPAWLQYNYVNTDTNGSRTNITFPEGGLSCWVRPVNWSSTNIEGGTGPGVPARLLELGAYSEQGNWGWFSLFLDEAGTVLSLGVQSNQFTAVPIQAPISWASNEWHQVNFNWTLTNLEMFVDAQLCASTTNGLPYWPNYGVLLTNGLFIGSDSSGSNIANADFEHVRFYDWAMPQCWITAQYNRIWTNYIQTGGGDSPVLGGGFGDTPDGGGMDGSTNGLALAISFDGIDTLLTVTGGTNGISYDLFYTTNLVGTNVSQSSWTWLMSVANGQSYYVYNQPSPIFYVLGTPQNSDTDSLTDAFELLVSKSSTATNFTRGDAIDDWTAYIQGRNPRVPGALPDTNGVVNLQIFTPLR